MEVLHSLKTYLKICVSARTDLYLQCHLQALAEQVSYLLSCLPNKKDVFCLQMQRSVVRSTPDFFFNLLIFYFQLAKKSNGVYIPAYACLEAEWNPFIPKGSFPDGS